MIGRTDELDRIRGVDAVPGSAAIVLVGDPGSGKSRLLAEAVAETARLVFRVVGYEPERLVPLAAASALLRELGVEEAFGPEAEPLRVFEATHRALEARGPVMLAVDDVQWVDDLSFALLHYVARAATSAGADLHVLAAGRPTARTHALAEDLTRILPPDAVQRVDLAGLSREDGVTLARALDATLDEPDAAALWERSAGLPFWIEALARARSEPVEAGRLLTIRLRDAGPDAAALLGLLAVVARPLADESAAALLEWAPARVEAAADDLAARGLTRRVRGSLALAHDLLRAAAFDELADVRRRDLHLAVAEWLEREAGGELSLLHEALQHRTAAGQLPLELALRVVSSPQRRRLGSDGLETIAAIAAAADASSAGAQTLRVRIGALAFDLGEHRLAFDQWTAALPFLREPEERFEALLGASKAALELRWEQKAVARELLAEALAHAPDDVARVEARTHEARILLWLDHRTIEGAAIARDALERSRLFGDGEREHRVRLLALHAAREASMQEADGEEMLRLAEEMLGLAAARDEDMVVEALWARAIAEQRTRPLATAAATVEQTLELATRRVLPALAAEAGDALAAIMHDRGRLDDAESRLEAAEAFAARLEGVRPARLVRSELELLRVRDGAEERYRTGIELRPDPHLRIMPTQFLAQFVARARGETARDDVVSLLRAAREHAVVAACPRCSLELHLYAAATLARIGCQEEAAAERQLRRLGVRTWRRGRSRVDDGSLSEREHEIALLVARGASNPEIAQALFLSRKTVERHVSNVLAKRGVRNRAELAAQFAREGEGAPR